LEINSLSFLSFLSDTHKVMTSLIPFELVLFYWNWQNGYPQIVSAEFLSAILIDMVSSAFTDVLHPSSHQCFV
jgi:hypothetical protein